MINDIKNVRERLGVTQQEIGAALGVTRVTYHSKEKGHNAFSVDELIRLLQFFENLVKAINAEKSAPKPETGDET